MDRLIKILVIASIIIYKQATLAQSNVSISELKAIDMKINESVFISTNSNSFLTGETILYKLYCLNNNSTLVSNYSKLAYVELVDSNKKTVFKQKLFLEDGTENGDLFLPTTLETGNYKLVGYTRWMLNKDNPDIFSKNISIINPYNVLNKNLVNISQDSLKVESKTVTNSSYFSINTTKKIFSNRELVTLDLKQKTEKENLNGNYSISVRKLDAAFQKNNSTVLNKTSNEPVFNSQNILPEFRGEIICGKIISKSNKNTENINISLSIPGKNYTYKITKTNKKGEFIFNLDTKNTSQNLIFQIIDSEKEDFKIEVLDTKSPNYSALVFEKLQIYEVTKNIIEEKAIANQIENAYYEKKKDSLYADKDLKAFYNTLQTEYILDNYTRFPTLKETIIEVIEGMYFTKTNKNYTLHLRDFDLNNKLDIPAMIIVDGLFIQDINDLLDHKADLFSKIDIIKGGYYFGSKLYNGLISFTTKAYDYDSKLKGDFILKPEILRPVGRKEYFQPKYFFNNNLSKIPDYRHQLLWIPNVKLENKERSFSFFTSDVLGAFEIILEGFTNTGIPIYESEIIEVK